MIDAAGDGGRFTMKRVARNADDTKPRRKSFSCPLLCPIERRALRVGIDQRDAQSLSRPGAGEMQRERRLADAAFLVEERDNHGATSTAAAPARLPGRR
jgi:hypothetical protein